jgi:hypothetical protein
MAIFSGSPWITNSGGLEPFVRIGIRILDSAIDLPYPEPAAIQFSQSMPAPMEKHLAAMAKRSEY